MKKIPDDKIEEENYSEGDSEPADESKHND